MDEIIVTRFLAKVDKTGSCWVWTGAKQAKGYGRVTINKRSMLAHRAAYSLFIAAIPAGVLVCHRCDNTSCVNPDHLFLGTHQDNVDDCIRKGRFVVGWRGKGTQHPRAKLSEDDVRAIYADTRSQFAIADAYGVSQQLISRIKQRGIWRHLAL